MQTAAPGTRPDTEAAAAGAPVPASSRDDAFKTSCALQLSAREWAGLGAFTLLVMLLAPAVWRLVEPLDAGSDYRIPYELSNDYWLFERVAGDAAARFDTVLMGDSFIWGQYVKPEGTLSHYLNELAGAARVGNLGLDGAHPVALAGLTEHYAGAIRGKTVVLHCNPLWMSSARHDLQGEEEFRFNHPALGPQFTPRIPCYRESVSARIGLVIERNVGFKGWTSHLQLAYFDQTSIPEWTIDHPYASPLGALGGDLPAPRARLRHRPVSWVKRGIKPKSFEWVAPASSVQWSFFKRAVETLRARGNTVFVMVGPFNEHLIAPEARPGYRRILGAIDEWLRTEGVPGGAPEALPSHLYGDASHPLAAGYEILARWLAANLDATACSRERRPMTRLGKH